MSPKDRRWLKARLKALTVACARCGHQGLDLWRLHRDTVRCDVCWEIGPPEVQPENFLTSC